MYVRQAVALQDTLNRLNQPFFGVADAIFINYTWKAWTPPEAALAAGDGQTCGRSLCKFYPKFFSF